MYIKKINKSKQQEERLIPYDHPLFNQEVAKWLIKKDAAAYSSVMGTSELNYQNDIREIPLKKCTLKLPNAEQKDVRIQLIIPLAHAIEKESPCIIAHHI